MTDQLSQAARERAQNEVSKAQAAAQEELTIKLSNQVQDKDNEIAQFRRTITEKDLEIAKAVRELDENNTAIRQSQSTDQLAQDALKAENATLQRQLQDSSAQSTQQQAELNEQVSKLQQDLKAEKDKTAKEAKKAEQSKAEQLNMTQAMTRIKEEFKQEFSKETQKNKFALELEYQTKLQNRENQLRQQFNTNQSSSDQQA